MGETIAEATFFFSKFPNNKYSRFPGPMVSAVTIQVLLLNKSNNRQYVNKRAWLRPNFIYKTGGRSTAEVYGLPY